MDMTKSLSVQAAEIPLYLLPKVIARFIREKGNAMYRISIARTHWHHYNVSVRTKRIKRELVPVKVALLEALPGDTNQKKKTGRRCAA
jgi:hypothetical protein